MLKEKQERFCTEYLIDCNASAAARRAGYSAVPGGRLLENEEVRAQIGETLKTLHDERVADASEILCRLTALLRGEGGAKPSDALRAAELLGRRYGVFASDAPVASVMIVGDVREQ